MNSLENSRDYPKSLRTNLLCGLATGLCAGLFVTLVNQLALSPSKVRPVAQIGSMFLALVVYSVSALVVYYLSPISPKAPLPPWLLIPIVGNLIFVVFRLGPGVVAGWLDPLASETSLLEYVMNEVRAASSLLFALSVVTLPITALIYHRPKLIESARLWHQGVAPPSISPTQDSRK